MNHANPGPVCQRLFFGILVATLLLPLAACAAGGDVTQSPVRVHPSAPAGSAMPAVSNPAEQRCRLDGYQVVPLYRNGIPVDSLCVNPHNGRRCGVWDYFRHRCRLAGG